LQTSLSNATVTLPFQVSELEAAVQDIQLQFNVAPPAPIHLLTPPELTPPGVMVPSSQQPLLHTAVTTPVARPPQERAGTAAVAELAALRADVDDLQIKVLELDHSLVSI
jgi:hypothetical protein